MDDGQSTSDGHLEHPDAADPGAAEQSEVVDGVLVVAAVRTLEPVRVGPPPFMQVAAVAATGFMAGAATAAVLGRRMSRVQARRAPASPLDAHPARPGGFDVVASQRFLVDVHTLVRR